MPLDSVARRHADGLFIQSIEKIGRRCTERSNALKRAYFENGLSPGQIHLLVFREVELHLAVAEAEGPERHSSGKELGGSDFRG